MFFRNIQYSKSILVLVLMIVFTHSCKKDTIATIDLGYNYCPVKIGKYVIYDVDSIVKSGDFKADTFKFQIKEQIDSIVTDNVGRITYKLKRYIRKKNNDTIPYNLISWTLKDVWVLNRTETTAEQVEENCRFIKLIFPIKQDKTWNGNAYNVNKPLDYEYTEVDVPHSYGGLNFDSTVFVTQWNYKNNIQKNYYVEVYAKNIGMIYKQMDSVKLDIGVSIEKYFKEGFRYKMVVNSYGTE